MSSTALQVPAARPRVGALYLADIGIPPRLHAELGLSAGGIFDVGSIVLIEDNGSVSPG